MVAIEENNMSESRIVENPSSSKITFTQALLDKYVNQEEFDDGLVVPKDESISTDITFVGFSTVSSVQKQLYKLASLDLSNLGIVAAGPLKEIDGKLSRVQTLNLANNNLPCHQIALIISYIPNLRELILTSNRLILNCSVETPRPTKSLESITLGRTNLDLSSVIVFLSRIWLGVEQIDLWGSNLDDKRMALRETNEFDYIIEQIRILWLSHNNFSDLSFLARAGPIKNLVELDVSNCGLNCITIADNLATLLKNLRVLNVSYNNLSDWRSISNLHVLQNLENLMCHENPIFITEKFARVFTIGRLGKLKLLNREDVTQRIRRDFEIFYLRKTFPEYQAFKNDRLKDFSRDHPRYDELLSTYGVPEDLTRTQAVDKYINVELCLADKRLTKKLPCDMRIANVRMLCKRLFKLKPSSSIKIICNTGSPDNDINYILDKDCQTLDFFSVKNGHRLLIEELK